MNFSDGELMMAMGAGRAMRQTEAHAQAIVNAKNRKIAALERQLAAAQREIAALRAERGGRNMARLAAAAQRMH